MLCRQGVVGWMNRRLHNLRYPKVPNNDTTSSTCELGRGNKGDHWSTDCRVVCDLPLCVYTGPLFTLALGHITEKGEKEKEKKFLSFVFVCFPRRWKMPSTATCYDVNPNYIVYSPILVQAMRCTQLFNGTSLSYWWAIVRIYIYIWWATKETAVLYEFEKAKGLFFSRFSEVLKQPVMTG